MIGQLQPFPQWRQELVISSKWRVSEYWRRRGDVALPAAKTHTHTVRGIENSKQSKKFKFSFFIILKVLFSVFLYFITTKMCFLWYLSTADGQRVVYHYYGTFHETFSLQNAVATACCLAYTCTINFTLSRLYNYFGILKKMLYRLERRGV